MGFNNLTFLGAHPSGLNPCGGILKTFKKTESQEVLTPRMVPRSAREASKQRGRDRMATIQASTNFINLSTWSF